MGWANSFVKVGYEPRPTHPPVTRTQCFRPLGYDFKILRGCVRHAQWPNVLESDTVYGRDGCTILIY